MTLRTVALVGTALLIAACAREEPMSTDLGQPIYAKDGITIVGYSNDMDGNGLADDDDDFDGDGDGMGTLN